MSYFFIFTFYNIHHGENLGQTSICSIDTHYSMLQMISVEGAEVWPDEATACTVEGRGCCWRNVKADQSRTTATMGRGGACDTQLAFVESLG